MSTDPTWNGLYMVGGASFLLIGILVIIEIVLLLLLGGLPTSGQAVLTSLSGQTGFKLLYQSAITISAGTHLLFIPAVLALYVALKWVKKTYALIASGLVGLFIVVDLSVNVVNFFSLVALSDKYSVATTEAQRAAYVAAADLSVAAIAVGLPLATVAISVGVLLFGLAMLKGVFNKGTAYLALLAGIVGIVGSIPISALAIVVLIAIILTAIWSLVVGFKLSRLV